MKKTIIAIVAICAFSYHTSAITTDSRTHADFEMRRAGMRDQSMYAVFDSDTLSEAQRAAMEFLYAYMPLPDIAGYPAEFFIANVNASLLASREMPWGAKVPEREFLHFVLPVRVNNENLDMARIVFYAELKERVRNLSMSDAILEVNHWCHEKVTYQPSDGRTSSPLSTVSQAIGRCGEESTFTVAALRAVGIPARQVYTPRWAHTDDNHAWVEAWADGQWHFIGACEPEPILDLAWFNSPASRGMLMNTNVTGPYSGPEEKLRELPIMTTINVTANYAPVGVIDVLTVYPDGTPAAGVTVDFTLYNYAEFYPVATKVSDNAGHASLTSGLGDMLVWASDGVRFGFAKGNPANKGPLLVVLDKDQDYTGTFTLDIVPPKPSASLPSPTEEQRTRNDLRSAYEDSIRRSYMSTFYDADMASAIAHELDADSVAVVKILTEARGNGATLAGFLKSVASPMRERALSLLLAVSEKDRRDITAEVIEDHLYNTPVADSPLWMEYILNPRVENEGLTPYKSFFRSVIPEDEQAVYRDDPSAWIRWTMANISIDSIYNPAQLRMDPRVVWRQRKTDPRSRNLFFVAGARSMGIPARIDPVTGKTQYADSASNWIDVNFGMDAVVVPDTGILDLTYDKVGRMDDPKYYYQYALSRIEGGCPLLLEFDEGVGVHDMVDNKPVLDAGRYMLLSGQRMADGSVLVAGNIFKVEPNDTVSVPLIMRQDDTGVQVIGSLNAENRYRDSSTGEQRSILSATGRGYYVLGLLKPNHEPTVHALNDISMLRDDFERWGKKLVLLFDDDGSYDRFDSRTFASLPSTAVFGVDTAGASAAEIFSSLNLATSDYPVFVIADTFNRIVFVSQGYTIGLGDRLMDTIHKLSE